MRQSQRRGAFPKRGVITVADIGQHNPSGPPVARAWCNCSSAICGLVANSTSGGTPAR